MKDIKDISKVYFIGIGGIGMSALARYFKFQGKEVSGYDKTETELTKQLVSEGIPVHYEEKVELAAKDPDIVVYTPAVPKEHKELLYYQENNYTILKRSDVLGMITNPCPSVSRAHRFSIAWYIRDDGSDWSVSFHPPGCKARRIYSGWP